MLYQLSYTPAAGAGLGMLRERDKRPQRPTRQRGCPDATGRGTDGGDVRCLSTPAPS